MRDTCSVVASCGYVLTPAGREALRSPERCECRPRVEGGLFVCDECGTVYAVLRQLSYLSGSTAWRDTK